MVLIPLNSTRCSLHCTKTAKTGITSARVKTVGNLIEFQNNYYLREYNTQLRASYFTKTATYPPIQESHLFLLLSYENRGRENVKYSLKPEWACFDVLPFKFYFLHKTTTFVKFYHEFVDSTILNIGFKVP